MIWSLSLNGKGDSDDIWNRFKAFIVDLKANGHVVDTPDISFRREGIV